MAYLKKKENQLESLTLGQIQWRCLDKLEAKNEHVDLSKIAHDSRFTDNIWRKKTAHSKDVYWEKEIIKENYTKGRYEQDEYPLLLLSKIVTYRKVCVMGAAISSIDIVFSFLNLFRDTLRTKSILIGNKNEEVQPISALTSEDITHVALLHLAKTNAISSTPFIFLNDLKRLPDDVLKEAPFLAFHSTLPWETEGISILKWITQLKKSEGLYKESKSYPPIALENVSQIVKHAMSWLENFEELTDVYNRIKKDFEQNGEPKSRRMRKPESDIILNYHKDTFDKLLPIKTQQINRSNKESRKPKIYTEISVSWFTEFTKLATGAALWIILLTTGLRNIDVRKLKVGCCKSTSRSDLLYYLVTDIQKTGQKNYVIPVPETTKLAVDFLTNVRRDFKSPFLVSATTYIAPIDNIEGRSALKSGQPLNELLRQFLMHYNISTAVSDDDAHETTCHCIRATLAGWIGANSHMAILLVRKLFGHTNALMPDAYLSHNPIIIKKRRENITNAQEGLAEDMVSGMINGKLSGTKGHQLLRGAKYIKDELVIECESITEMDMHVTLKERLKELLLQRINGGEVYAMLTPMGVVCMRNCNNTSDAPCAKQENHNKRKSQVISKEITDVMGTLPNPAHCVGKECSDALLGAPWSDPLLETFQFYVNYLKGLGNKSIDLKFEAEKFIKEYAPLLKEIYDEVDDFD